MRAQSHLVHDKGHSPWHSTLRFTPTTPSPACSSRRWPFCEKGGVLALPTDSSYALVCQLDDKNAVDRLRRIRQVNDKHHLTLLCRDLSELANYAWWTTANTA